MDALLVTLHEYWPDLRPGEPLGGGNRNVVIDATLGGERVVARQTPRSDDALAWELDLLAHLQKCGFVVPCTLPAKDGERFHNGVCVLSWLKGEEPVSEADWRLVASTLQRLHAVTAGWPQRPGFGGTREFLDRDRGGDIDLASMPEDGVARCRAAWRAIAGEPRSVVHGDPGAQNLRLTRHGVGMLDWDEARVDASVLDLAENPLAAEFVQPPPRLTAVQTAATAWEAANGWLIEPEYARRKLAALHDAKES